MKKKKEFSFPSVEVIEIKNEEIITESTNNFGSYNENDTLIRWR